MADNGEVAGMVEPDPDPPVVSLHATFHASGGVKAVWNIPPDLLYMGYVLVGYSHQMLLTQLLKDTPELKGGRLFRPRG